MAKGGKKKGKKDAGEDAPSVSGLSISEDAPSTSQAPEEEEESGLGLTGKSRKLNRKQKQAEAKAASAAALLAQPAKTPSGQASTSQVDPKPELKPEQKPEQEPEQKPESKPEPAKEQAKQEESDGLGLGGAKKKRPKKKSAAAVEAEAKAAAQALGPLQPGLGAVGPPTGLGPGGPPSGLGVAGPQQSLGSAGPPPGWGGGGPPQSLGSAGPPPGCGGAGPPQSLGSAGPPPGWGGAGPPQSLGPAGQPPGLGVAGPPQGWGVGPTQGSGPVGHPPGLGVAGPPPSVGLVGPQPATQGQRGRGRGCGRGSMPAGPTQAVPTQAGHGRAAPGPPAVGATQTPLQQPSGASRQVVPATSRLEMSCRYKIPAKVLGRSVRHIPTRVITNYLPMVFQPIKVYRYDVTVKPDRPKKMMGTAFKLAKEKHYPKEFIAFDQVKNCYSLNQLKDVPTNGSSRSSMQIEITDPNGKIMKFEVTLKATGIIDFAKIKQHMESGGSTLSSPSEEIQCIDVILRQGALESYVKCGRQFFKRPHNPINLTGGLEMWTGLFQSAIFTSRAFINIDVAHKGFPIQQSLIDALTKSFRLDTNNLIERQRKFEVEHFMNFMKNLRVIATLVGPPNNGQKREFICNGLVDNPERLTFTCEREGKNVTMSVANYFRLEKGYKIKYPNLNCVWVGPRERHIYYPMELLDIAYGQALNKQLNEFQLSIMVKEAATPPSDRKRKIEEVAQCMNYSSNVFFKKFGLDISNQFLEVEAKILTPPSLDTGDRSLTIPKRGSWMSNRLVKPEPLVSWGFIAIECNPVASNYEEIRSSLMNIGRQLGMEVAEPKLKMFNVAMTELRNILFAAQDKDIKFIFIIVSSRVKDMYHRVKQMAERDVGILTQCIKDTTASRRINPQTIKNILLKVNSKLMGVNQVLDPRQLPNCLRNGDVMIVGADVTHPSPEQTSIPSIAAVTASMDSKCFSYNIELSIQAPKKEMIVEFADMMYDHLVVYRERNRALPRKIYVFRDGVSEGQFAEVMNSELTAVHKAYQRLSPQQKPEVLFLLVQKRHHTRFFTVKNCANVEPGTVVDNHIVHPKELDFYLVSHQAIKGTARPTRYHAVCNDGNIPHDEVEQLTFYLCHLYSRCMRSVSYPTPTYYAHLACLRAKSLTHGQSFDNTALERTPQRLRVLDKMLRFSRMFFV